MNAIRQVSVLNAFTPFLRLLNAYNRENFHRSTWHSILRSGFCAFGATMIIFIMPAFVVLLCWHLTEANANFENFLLILPLALSILQMEVIFIALLFKNRTLLSTICRLQEIIDQRECV